MRHWLFISCCFSCLLVCVRVAATGYLTYLFLVWNLFLALIPYMVSEWLFREYYCFEKYTETNSPCAYGCCLYPIHFILLPILFIWKSLIQRQNGLIFYCFFHLPGMGY